MKLISNLSIGSLRLILSAAGSSLLNGLVSYWPLNEVSGVRYDAVGSNDLTDNNTVGAKLRGPEGTVANLLAANSEYLSSADASLDLTGDFTYAIWYKQQPPDAALNMLMGNDPAGTRGIMCGIDGGDQLLDYWYITEGANYNHITYSIGEGVYSHVWRLAWFWREGSTMYCTKNTDDAGKSSGAIVGSAPYTGEFWIGRTQAGYGNIQAGPVGVWSRALTAQERADVFAQGNSLRYADLPASLLTGLVSYWHLDEVSGVRYDSHGSNDLTDNNTVGSVNSGPKGVVSSHDGNNNENFSCAWTPTAEWSVVGWVRQTTEQISSLAEWGTAWPNSVNGFQIMNNAGGHLSTRAWQGDGSNYATAGVNRLGGLGKWSLCAGRYDGAKVMASIDTDLYAEQACDGSSATGAGTLYIGTGGFSGQAGYYGNFAGIGIWSRSLTDGELVSLYNGGIGKRYADLTDGEKVGLVSYWNLDETSGVRYDSHGTNHLTDNNTVGSVINAGDAMDGAAASFVAANSEWLYRNAVTVSQPLTMSGWYRPSAIDAIYEFPFGVMGAWASQVGIQVYRYSTALVVSATDASGTLVQATSSHILSAGEWVHIVVWYDDSDSKVYISANGGAPVASPAAPGLPLSASMTVQIGANKDSGYPTTGQVDEVAIWDRVLTADERAELFALGRGKFYDFN